MKRAFKASIGTLVLGGFLAANALFIDWAVDHQIRNYEVPFVAKPIVFVPTPAPASAPFISAVNLNYEALALDYRNARFVFTTPNCVVGGIINYQKSECVAKARDVKFGQVTIVPFVTPTP